jgi:hypothetical protein
MAARSRSWAMTGGATFRVTIPDVVIDIGRARRSA